MVGILALLLAAGAAEPETLVASGMEPQLRVVRQEAARRHWPILCEGSYGDQGEVKIDVPAGTPEAEIDSFRELMASVASSYGDAVERVCERVLLAPDVSGPRVTMLYIGVDKDDEQLLRVARECGYAKAHWRPARVEDMGRYKGQPQLTKYFFVLDAGEDLLARYGPLTCFQVLGLKPDGSSRSETPH